MNVLVTILSAAMAFIVLLLVGMNVFVVIATALHRRRDAMRILSHFSRAVDLLRLADDAPQSRANRHW